MTKDKTSSLRSKAIERARARIRQDGHANLRMSDVARDLDVTHAALYKYFTSKQDLLDAVNLRWMDDINHQLHRICLLDDTVSSRIKLWFLTLYTLRREKVLSDSSEYAAYIHTEELARQCAQNDALERKRQLTVLVKEGLQDGMFKDDSEKIVNLLFNTADHFIHPAFIASHAEIDKQKDFAYMLDVVLEGLSITQVNS